MKWIIGLLCIAIIFDLAIGDPVHLRLGFLELRQAIPYYASIFIDECQQLVRSIVSGH